MRVLLTVEMDTEKTGKVIADNRLAEVMRAAFDRLKPEAAYFTALDGLRTGLFVFDLRDTADIPRLCEPLFQELGARINLTPAMDIDDVEAGMRRHAEA